MEGSRAAQPQVQHRARKVRDRPLVGLAGIFGIAVFALYTLDVWAIYSLVVFFT